MACAFVALAGGGAAAARKQVEASMVLTGSITVAPDGHVSAYTLDTPAKLEKGIVAMVNDTVPSWRFEPVLRQGKAVASTARMSLQVVAKKVDADHFSIGIRNANFSVPAADATSANWMAGRSMTPPRYPPAAYRSGVTGTVYLVARLGTDGQVLEVVAEQVNLGFVGSESEMAYFRDALAKPALQVARSWRLTPASEEEAAAGKIRSVRIPVAYRLDAMPGYGHWESYVPGPKQPVPWLAGELDALSSPDALVAGNVYEVGKGLHLLTPLGES
jgi:hypothetical protein